MSFAAVHIPEFPIAAWLSKEPELNAKPLVLLRGIPPQEAVASLSAIAQASGVAHGMSKVQAEAACAAHFRSRSPEEERRAFTEVLRAADHFSPRVQAIASPANEYANQDRLAAALLIDRSGTGSLFGSAPAYAERLRHDLGALGFPCSIATAPNAEAALMLSRSGSSLTCVEQTDLAQRLAPAFGHATALRPENTGFT